MIIRSDDAAVSSSTVPESGVQAAAPPPAHWSVLHSLKLGTFHIGSSLADLLTSAVWNRVLITDLGVAAWLVALLSALRYLLAPLTLWAGYRSDTRPIFGSRRVAYIWLGRLLMLLSLPLLPLAMVEIARDVRTLLGWTIALLSFLLYGIGTLVSGAPFLALVHDSAPYEKRGQAVSVVQMMLVVSFAFIPAMYAVAMPAYDQALFRRLVLTGMIGAAIFWLFSVWGEERRYAAPTTAEAMPGFRAAFSMLWADDRARKYALFLAASAFFAFMQDAMLEPFGGDVFGLGVGETTRFNSYWGTGVLLGMIGTIVLTRRRRPDQQISTTAWGLALLGAPLALLGLVALLRMQTLLMPVLIFFGFGFGIFTIGGVSLLMAMSSEERAGSYLALWSVIQLVARGAGIAMGGVIRDGALLLTGEMYLAYAALFLIEAVGIFGALMLLRRVDIVGFAAGRTTLLPAD
jgi:BCD family chlorophyll transporter-like MFS transporter